MAFVKNTKKMTQEQADACSAIASAFCVDKNPNAPVRVKPCRYVERCNKGDKCTYAHTLEELEPIVCGYKNCQKEGCSRLHSWESMDDYCNKNGYFCQVPEFDPYEVMIEMAEVDEILDFRAWCELNMEWTRFMDEVHFHDWITVMQAEVVEDEEGTEMFFD